MRVSVGPGTYVVAVSGGVDSMVLLDLLVKQYRLSEAKQSGEKRKVRGVNRTFVVAHFDHGIRPDSHKDRQLVQRFARRHGLAFVYHQGSLGPETSEAVARDARYAFLEHVRKASGANAIITAHHQDDVLETALLNILRGSGRRGLTSLKSTDGIIRPLLEYDKDRIYEYAQNHAISWREDPTNTDTRYTRNYLRQHILPRLAPSQRAQVTILLDELLTINHTLDHHLINLLHMQPKPHIIERGWFIGLPHDVARELVHAWLRHRGIKDITRKLVERMVVAMKTSKPGKLIDIDAHTQLAVHKNMLELVPRQAAKHRPRKRPAKH